RIEGHRAGIDGVRAAVRTAAQLHMQALTLYAFSTENWSRPRMEILALMELLDRFLIEEIPELQENNIRLVASGQIGDLPNRSQDLLAKTMKATEGNTGLVLNLALSYGGRQELVTATRRIAEQVRAGSLNPDQITPELFA